MTAVQTVLGAIDSAQLGTVLSHEHVLQNVGEDTRHYPWMFDWEQTRAGAISALSGAKAGGVDKLVIVIVSVISRRLTNVTEQGQRRRPWLNALLS